MSLERVLMLIAASALVSGCHLFTKLNPDCHTKQEYQHALSAQPLKVPPGLDSPNTAGAEVGGGGAARCISLAALLGGAGL